MDADDIEDLKTDILRQATANAPPIPFWDMVQGFYHAVDWSEPWIIGLGVVHVALFLVRRGRRCPMWLLLRPCLCADWRSFATS